MRKWGLKDGKLVRIEEEDRGVVCAGCGEPLIPHKGKKRGWYFSHRAGTPECSGSARAVAGKLMLESFERMTEYTIPASLSGKVAGGLYTYPGETIVIESVKPHGNGVMLNDKYLVHPHMGPGCRPDPLSYEYIVIVDTSSLEKRIDDVTDEEAFEFFKSGKSSWTLTSPEISHAEEIFAEFYRDLKGEFFICPASMIIDDSRLTVMTKEQCKHCPFRVGNGCLGAGCIKDFEKDAFANRSALERYEDYHTMLPTELGVVKFHPRKPFGVCDKCGHDMELAQGNYGQKIANVARLKDHDEEAAFLVCPQCGAVKDIYCPVCKKQRMNVRRSRVGVIYLQCKDHFSGGEGCNGVLSTITVWRDENQPKEFADEILAVGNICKPDKGAEDKVLKARGKKE